MLPCLALAGWFPAAATLQAEPPPGYHLVFSDEFDGQQLDKSKWGTTMAFAGANGGRFHNASYLNYNVDENILFGDGHLRLKADRATTIGIDPPGLYQYTGSLISTDGRFAFQFGYVEIRARYPGGRGIWPVFWLMGQNQAWPPEFDIAEYYAGAKVMHMGLCHGEVRDPKWNSTGDKYSEAEAGFHTYALEWRPGRAVWYQDGVAKKVVEATYVPELPMYILLNNGVSSRFGPSGAPNEETVFPNTFEIDYVRVWQINEKDPLQLVKADEAAAPKSVLAAAAGPGPALAATAGLVVATTAEVREEVPEVVASPVAGATVAGSVPAGATVAVAAVTEPAKPAVEAPKAVALPGIVADALLP